MGVQAERTAGVLLEREAELEAVARVAGRAAEGTGALCVIDGPAGAGKTSVLEVARDAAADADLLILSARGAELEQAFAFGVARQLFEPILRDPEVETESLFTGAAQLAAPLLGVEPDGAASSASQDPFAARHAVYWLTANLASQRPLAIVLDDAHWADGASLGALAHIANRLEGLPVALVVASRSEESHDALDTIRRQAAETGVMLTPAPLSEDAAATVVRSFAPSADDALCRACYRASGGNPFLLHELAYSVAAGDGGSFDPEQVLDQSPERVTREVGARLARLTEDAAKLAGAAAVLGDDTQLRQAAALAGIGEPEAAAAADALNAAGLLRTAQPLTFMHPLVRAAVYAGVGPAARSSDHARAARLLAEKSASPERVAAQLLWCQPSGDEWACEQLLAAAQEAATRGSPEAAAKYLRRALDEPPPPGARAQIVLHLGAAETMASEPEPAIAHLREALAAEIAPEQRLVATMLLSGLLGHAYRAAEAADVVQEQLDALADRPELHATAAAALVNVTRIDPATRPRAASAIAGLRERVEEGDEDPAVLGTVATEMLIAGEPADRVAEVAERALAGIDWTTMAVADWVGFIAARVLVLAERFETARGALDDALKVLRDRGAMFDLGGGLAFRSELHLRTGDLASAEIDARTLMEIAADSGWTGGEGFATAWLTEVLVERGELDDADRLLEAGGSAATIEGMTRGYTAGEVLFARGRARLAQGRTDEAIESLRGCGQRVGNVNPAAFPWRSWLAHALLEKGQTNEARRLTGEELEQARGFGTPRAVAIALRAAARVEGGMDEVRMLREAIGALEGSPAQLEGARVHAALGAALRREGMTEEARKPLRVAVDMAHRCGADGLEDEALDELRATGARPRRRLTTGVGALTPSERRIAELAAGGQQNREIAETLFVTINTVEYHLRNAYRKLGISSRQELAEAL